MTGGRHVARRAAMLFFAALVVALFVPLVLWSFAGRWHFPDVLPAEWGLRAWSVAFGASGSRVVSALFQSALVAGATSAMALLIGVPAGRALGLYSFPGKDLVSVILMLPVIVPPLSVSMGLHLWFLKLGLAETYLGVVLVHLTFCAPYSIFAMWGVFSNYNPDFEDQARSLGASRLSVIFRVMLPLVLPGAAAAGLFSFLLSWSQYLSTLIIGGGRVVTLPIVLFSLMESGDRPAAAAVSLVFVAPAFVALLFSARYLGGKSMAGVW